MYTFIVSTPQKKSHIGKGQSSDQAGQPMSPSPLHVIGLRMPPNSDILNSRMRSLPYANIQNRAPYIQHIRM